MDEQPSAGAPPVVAVVVARHPGPWFEDALGALGSQDYPSLSVLVVDAGGDDDLTARVASVLPGAFVRRAEGVGGFGGAANEVLDVVEGASHFLFCHDDVAPAPESVRVLVEEAFRSNAGIVTPKFVQWDAPDRLLAVGLAVDKLAAPSSVVEPGELDQEQHDGVRDVFAGPSACMLVRSDLFSTLGGFDVAMAGVGDDIDLCWRAQLAGARVVVAPAARVRHREARDRGERDDERTSAGVANAGEDRRATAARSRLRTVLKDYGGLHLARVLPQAMLVALAELVWSVVTANPSRARSVVGAWTWNLGRLSDVRKARRRAQRLRAMSDGELRRLQVRGSARLGRFLRQSLMEDGGALSVASVGRGLAGTVGRGSLRLPIAVWTAVGVVVLFGSRHLGSVPAVGQLAPFPGGASDFFRSFATDWRTPGLGSSGPAPLAFALLGLAGTLLFGHTALLREVLVLGALPVGIAGAYRLARPLASRRARLAAVVVYAAVPVPYNALGRGRWQGLLMYAAAPFILRRLASATGLEPFTDSGGAGAGDDEHGWRRVIRHLLAATVPLAVLTAVVAAFVPSALVVVPFMALGLLAGSLVAGDVLAASRAVAAAVGATLVAGVLLFPWTLELVGPGAGWPAFTGVRSGRAALDFGAVLRFDSGAVGGVLGWGFLVAAALPLVIGRGWRLAWATRLWAVALVCWAVAWAAGRGSISVPLPMVEVLLAPAAAAIAGCVALGVVAFEVDLPDYAFGWPHAATFVAGVAVAAAVLPVLGGASGGRWELPQQDFAQLLSWMPPQREAGDFRVLWIGDSGNIPLAGWPLAGSGRLAYATSRGGVPDARDLWPGGSDGATHLLSDAVGVARRGETTHLGRLLAATGVRYVALPSKLAPGSKDRPASIPADITQALRSQLDLKEVESDPGLVVYENVAWAPMRVALAPEAAPAVATGSLAGATAVDLTGGRPVLQGGPGPASFSGTLDAGDDVLVAEASSPRWKLRSGGRAVARTRAFGWANAYPDAAGGRSSLHYATPLSRWVALALQVFLWAAALRWVVVFRRRRTKAVTGPADVSSPHAARDVEGTAQEPAPDAFVAASARTGDAGE